MQVQSFDYKGLHRIVNPDLKGLRASSSVLWLDLVSPTMEDMLQLQRVFGFHPLAIEDTRNEHQRPKVEEYADHLFIITNHAVYEEDELCFREIDMFLGRNYLVTVHDTCVDVMDKVQRRMNLKDNFRHVSSEYLLYVLLDTIVDDYFPLMDRMDNEIETLSEQVLESADRNLLMRLFELKRMLNEAWYVVGQERDMFAILTRREADLITHHDVLEYYLRDVSDHLIRVGDIIAVMREDLKNIADLYVSSTSNRLNKVVNRLTIITIMIGAFTVISGFYGMNFARTWPPFEAEWGVLFVLALMAFAAAGVLVVFKWLELY